jgi:hypothetical protein
MMVARVARPRRRLGARRGHRRLGARPRPAQARARRVPAQRGSRCALSQVRLRGGGRRLQHVRRADGPAVGLVEMGLLLGEVG